MKNAKKPLVSIVTPSLNQGRFVEETLQSVLTQDYPCIEYIVVDGGSTDGTLDVLKRYKDRFAWCVSEPDGGQSQAINKGLRRATGTYLAWLNSDDILYPEAVSRAVAALEGNEHVGLAFGDRIVIDEMGRTLGNVRCPRYYRQQLGRNITLPQESCFFRRSQFEAVDGLDERLAFAMDFDLWCRLAVKTTFRHVSGLLGGYRVHGEAKSVRFHQESGSGEGGFRSEHERVFFEHFGRPIPDGWRARKYRYLHRLRAVADSLRGDVGAVKAKRP